jgi:ATP synthase F1 complex assembly factor 1
MEDYKKYGSNSTPYFILTLFDELLFQKSLVLIRGDIINYKLNKNEA